MRREIDDEPIWFRWALQAELECCKSDASERSRYPVSDLFELETI
jgi:hypothetical protein